jgi:hypothetical protein
MRSTASGPLRLFDLRDDRDAIGLLARHARSRSASAARSCAASRSPRARHRMPPRTAARAHLDLDVSLELGPRRRTCDNAAVASSGSVIATIASAR